MKYTYHLTFSLILASLLTNAATAIECSQKPNTKTKAEACVEEILKDPEALYEYVKSKSHTGDIKKCPESTSKDGKSYFTDNEEDFKEGIKNAALENCAPSNDPDAFKCWIKNGPDACYIAKDEKGEVTNRIGLRLGKSSGKLVTFYPEKP